MDEDVEDAVVPHVVVAAAEWKSISIPLEPELTKKCPLIKKPLKNEIPRILYIPNEWKIVREVVSILVCVKSIHSGLKEPF